MDAYIPLDQTAVPRVAPRHDDQPWRLLKSTQTLVWFEAPATVPHATESSGPKQVTFFIVDAPELAGLERLRTFSGWCDNWDAEGAKAPDRHVLDTATKVFSLLSVYAVPQVALTAEGHPMFTYSGRLRGEVTVTSNASIDYFFVGADSPADEDVVFDGMLLPAPLVEYLGQHVA